MSDSDAIIGEFLVESYENLDQLDQDLVELEQNPTEQSLLARIFRTIHTIKGTCGFIGFSKLESVAHVGENLLSKLRDGELHLNPAITSALLSMVDAIRQILSCIENQKDEGEVDYSQLIDILDRLQRGVPVDAVPEVNAAAETPVSAAAEPPAESSSPAEA
ncbi:MAG: histidine kinase, partial [Nitrospinaceae bacterium]|nr:histidine kinase [Nitrospinaceae bacterium]NIR57916.1 histidine kinase [Nitrospinaceae bacterium]NIS88374.1 histidine kinase [Nitrospinaceae bacterium]NIT85252.1 histidine kinase [Nitrospinaceae bacterium]NIU47405.1 histidine kinase [Nitrospinaceae bacterium]